MTISRERRKLEMQVALIRFYRDVGDRAVGEVDLRPDGPEYSGLWYGTTWASLAESQQLERVGRPVILAYRLTTFGWYTGLKLAGGLESAEVRDRATKLVQAMKLSIDGRRDHDPKAVAISKVAEAAGVPHGWASNALHAGFLLEALCGGSKMNAYTRAGVDTVIIPPTFGQSSISYDELANDRSELIKIKFE